MVTVTNILRLVNRVVDDGDLADAPVALAATIPSNSRHAVRATKRTLAVAVDASFAATLEVKSLAPPPHVAPTDACESSVQEPRSMSCASSRWRPLMPRRSRLGRSKHPATSHRVSGWQY
jgi:hypothetical protein